MTTPSVDIIESAVTAAIESGKLGFLESDLLDVERVFLRWAENPAITKAALARATGISPKVVGTMLESGIFQKKLMEHNAHLAELTLPYMQTRARMLADRMMTRLEMVLDLGSDKDALAAIRQLRDLAGDTSGQAAGTTVDIRVLQIASEGLSSIEDLRRVNRAALSGNIAEVDAARAGRNGGSQG